MVAQAELGADHDGYTHYELRAHDPPQLPSVEDT
jgi:hypothetical protein